MFFFLLLLLLLLLVFYVSAALRNGSEFDEILSRARMPEMEPVNSAPAAVPSHHPAGSMWESPWLEHYSLLAVVAVVALMVGLWVALRPRRRTRIISNTSFTI